MPLSVPWSISLILRKVGFKRSDKRRRDLRQSQPSPPSALLRLPSELLYEIAFHLSDPSDILSLSSTSSKLRRLLCDTRGLVFRFNLRHNGWDEDAVARKAKLCCDDDGGSQAGASEEKKKKKKRHCVGDKEWLVLARSAFHKSSAAATKLESLPIQGTEVKRRTRQKRGRVFIRKLAEIVNEHDTRNFDQLFTAFSDSGTDLLDYVSSIRLLDAESRYTQSFIMAAYINWLASQSRPLPLLSGIAIGRFLSWTRESSGRYQRQGAMLTLHTEINCVYITSHVLLSQHAALSAPSSSPSPSSSSLPSYHLRSTLFDPSSSPVTAPLPPYTSARVSERFAWLPRVVAQWNGEIRVRGFLARELGIDALTPFEMDLVFATKTAVPVVSPTSKYYREAPRTFIGRGTDPAGEFIISRGSIECTIGLVEFERDGLEKLSYCGVVTAFGLLGMCRSPDGLQGHFILRIEGTGGT